MRTRTKWLATLAGAALTAGLAASPAMAAQTPGPGASQVATVSIEVSLQMSTTLADFTLTSANVSTSSPAGGGTLSVQTNDPSGFFINLTGPASWTGPAGMSTAALSFNGLNSSTWATLSSTATEVASSPSPTTGTDFVTQGFFMNTLPGSPGTYTGTIHWDLWGN